LRGGRTDQEKGEGKGEKRVMRGIRKKDKRGVRWREGWSV
jgi:hypothetical protein